MNLIIQKGVSMHRPLVIAAPANVWLPTCHKLLGVLSGAQSLGRAGLWLQWQLNNFGLDQ